MADRYDDTSETPTVWRHARASRAHVVVDACAYFDLMNLAMCDARQRIMLIGWDFDTRIHLARGRRWWNLPVKKRPPARLGGYILWLTERTKGLQVRVLKWNFGALKFVFRGSMALDLARWMLSKAVDFKFDSAHPFGCSHHQKIVVIDDRFAVCGGIDMTSDRWDTPAHIDEDARRRMPFSRKLYGPWHDLTMMVEGEAAEALGALGRMRWEQAGGDHMEPCRPQEETAWPEKLSAEFRDVEVGIARTRAAYKDLGVIDEIEQLYLEHIGRAKRFIYAESQYFASRTVAEAIARRMAEPDPPEIVLINPESAEGWLEQAAMDGARVRLARAIREVDHKRRFRIFLPMTAGGTAIYVHAKMMIVDDEIVRVGSSNLNNRSMGLDTEADLFIDAARPGNDHARAPIRALRYRLLAEHLGTEPETVAAALDGGASMIDLIESAPRHGKHLAPFELRELTPTEITVADNALLDPEKPEELFEPLANRRGLFGGSLRRPRLEENETMSSLVGPDEDVEKGKVPVPDEVQEAIRTLIRWSGDDPTREGLVDTPKRVARAWKEYCLGYGEDPAVHLSRVFEEVGGYNEIVLLKDIPFQSHCEHHMAPIIGKAAIAYLPTDHVVGISKLARVLHGFARRLQVQERLTAEVAQCIWDHLRPQGVAVVIEAAHSCMTARGVRTPGVGMVTSRMMGTFLDDQRSRKEVLSLMGY